MSLSKLIVSERDCLSLVLLLAVFFLLLCLCNIHEQRVGEGLGPPQVTVLTRKSQCL